MAAALPSILQGSGSQLDSIPSNQIKSEKNPAPEEEFDVTGWLDDNNLNHCFTSPSSSSSSSSSGYSVSGPIGTPFGYQAYPNGFPYGPQIAGASSSSFNSHAAPSSFSFGPQGQAPSALPSQLVGAHPHHQLPPMVAMPQGNPLPQSASSLPQLPPQYLPYPVVGGVVPPMMNYSQMTPQMYQLFAQFQSLLFKPPQPTEQSSLDDKKKNRSARTFARRVRQTRPKVVEAKGAVQCKGRNRKKGTQCRNAALMEYMGPRPIYCAEHIELDPKSLYEKCKAGYQKEPGDSKGCKEVVLKEFGVCYKHYSDTTADLVRANALDKCIKQNHRIQEIRKSFFLSLALIS